MKDKNFPDDIRSQSISELTEKINNIIQQLEKEKNLENSLEEYQKFVNGEDSEYIGRLTELDTYNFSLDSYLVPGDYVFIVHNY